MALPWAHPAAVLPFRRWCPRYFSFLALVFGSMLPDFAYAIDDLNKFSRTVRFVFGSTADSWIWVKDAWDWDDWSHTLSGTFGFCLPVGLTAIAIFIALRKPLVTTLPNPHREILSRLCSAPRASFRVTTISLLVSAWIHIAWDSLTNPDRWLAQHWSFLHFRVAQIGDGGTEIYRLIWLLTSLAGTAALAVSYVSYLRHNAVTLFTTDPNERPYYVLWSGLVLLSTVPAIAIAMYFEPLRLSSPFLHRFTGFYVASFAVTATTVAVVRSVVGDYRAVDGRPSASGTKDLA
jgi:predicted small integral membrane protein